jgi:uncharacterized protein YecE (DUF72 family)
MAKFYIGTSGWQYKHWKGNFYPKDLAQKDWLKHYCQKFNSVEVNSSFYRLPKPETFEKWASETPKDFVFSIKGNRFITHIQRLKDCKEPLERFFEAAGTLLRSNKSAVTNKNVVLWQLPPSSKKNLVRLGSFLGELPKTALWFRHAFEFRHGSWLDKKVFDFLDNFKSVDVTVVLQDWQEWPVIEKPVGKFVYLRFHGRKRLYTSNYSKKELEQWALKMQKWTKKGLGIYAYFNNDAFGYAPKNAAQLKELV